LSEQKINSNSASFFSKFIKQRLPAILTCLVGLVLLVSGLQKSFEVDLFIRQIGDYDIISNPVLILLGAWGIIIVEFCLGTALILNYRPKIAIPPAVLLLLVFIGATGWAWYTGATDDCGCFGSWVERTPAEAMIEDIVFLGFLLFGWVFNKTSRNWPFHLKEGLLALALIIGFTLPLLTGTLPDRINRLISGPVEEGKEIFNLHGFSSHDLSKGRYLVVVMATDCSHCRALMEDLIIIGDEDELPPVIALVMNDEEQIEDFIDEFDLEFGLYQVPDDDFWRLLEDGEIPRTILIDNGIIIQYIHEGNGIGSSQLLGIKLNSSITISASFISIFFTSVA